MDEEDENESVNANIEMNTEIDDKCLVVLTEPATVLSVACTLDAKVSFLLLTLLNL